MLLSFRFGNFRSFRDEQEFSFVRGTYTGPPAEAPAADGPRSWDERVGVIAGLYGPNASGKSNVLKALKFMRDAVYNSYQTWKPGAAIPLATFKLEPAYDGEPSLFETTFVFRRIRFQYGFRLTRKEVVGEWLYAYPSARRQIWFERDISSRDVYYFGKSFAGRNRVIADLTRRDSLFLSAAVANNHKQADSVGHWIRAHLTDASPDNKFERTQYTADLSRTDDDRWHRVTELMKFADLGICAARVRQEKLAGNERERLRRLARSTATGAGLDGSQGVEELIDQALRVIEFGHNGSDGKELVYFPFEDESLGTQVWFSLIGPVLRALKFGDTLVIDELDASLHPHLTSEILSIFRDPRRNPRQAQLVFSSHDTTLLGSLLGQKQISRDQVWFTEKDRDGASTLYPLTDYAPRISENFERGYLQGRYGAVPFLDVKILDGALGNESQAETHWDDGNDHASPDDKSGNGSL